MTACALALSTAGHAQDEQPAPAAQSEIVVDGIRDRKKLIRTYIGSVMAEEPEGQYARFEAPVCPSAIGFADDTAAFIEQRMLAVARSAEVRTAREGCRPNIHLLIVDSGRDAVDELRRRGSNAFGRMLPYQRQQIAKQDGPVFNWHVVTPIASDTRIDRRAPGTGTTNDVGGEGTSAAYSFLSEDRFNAGRTHVKSRIIEPVMQSITHAFVLIERDAILGLSPVQIADYATLMALARVEADAEDAPPLPSIRTLFAGDPASAPEALTAWDLGLLTSLYASPGDRRSAQQRSAMIRHVAKVLEANQ